MPRPHPFDHDHEQHPLSATSPAGLAGAEPDGVNMDRLLTADEFAERLGMKTEWVWAQARAGRIPHVRLGRYRRFRESAVEAWLGELETGGPASPQSRPIALRRRA
jgi:excisionase family DNA binding protein